MFILTPHPHRLYPCLFPPHSYVHPNPPQTIPCLFPPHLYVQPNPNSIQDLELSISHPHSQKASVCTKSFQMEFTPWIIHNWYITHTPELFHSKYKNWNFRMMTFHISLLKISSSFQFWVFFFLHLHDFYSWAITSEQSDLNTQTSDCDVV